ncbi:glycan-binding surface protein [Flammeovirga sp. EKP202]|uniref:glycan-binding surface protein n=1 Tax=Flammeovirga sp. EKP202 TaxID=2770592 RepID=UPI00165F29BA|nr:glycan-binding surface protein [Flammeovirga sp. EKP202]MBD0402802.1 hypothetical protein [Flammeovirga sp. EKP202]
MRRLFLPIYIIVALVMQGLFSSCTNETEDAPAISMVRYTDPDLADQDLAEVGLGEVIAIVGKGLGSTVMVTLNDMELSLSPVYITDGSVIVTVPDDVPTVATNSSVSNKLVVTTSNGMIERDLIVLPPAPSIESISNEFAKAGDSFKLSGKYFYFVEKVVFPGGIEVTTGLNVNDEATSLTLTVPDGVTEAGAVEVVTASGTSSTAPRFMFNDKTGMVCNFDDLNIFSWGVGPGAFKTEDGLDGVYVHTYQDSPITPGSWWDNNWVIAMNGYAGQGLNGAASDYALKFEVNVGAPLNSGRIQMQFIGDNGPHFLWKPWEINKDMTRYWEFTGDREPFQTEGWETIVIPIELFRYSGGAGAPVGNVADIDGQPIRFALQNADDPEGEEIPMLDIKYDNIRIVKIK